MDRASADSSKNFEDQLRRGASLNIMVEGNPSVPTNEPRFMHNEDKKITSSGQLSCSSDEPSNSQTDTISSSGADDKDSDNESKKRYRRLAMNRITARERRKRKKVHLEDLEREVENLTKISTSMTSQNRQLKASISRLATAINNAQGSPQTNGVTSGVTNGASSAEGVSATNLALLVQLQQQQHLQQQQQQTQLPPHQVPGGMDSIQQMLISPAALANPSTASTSPLVDYLQSIIQRQRPCTATAGTIQSTAAATTSKINNGSGVLNSLAASVMNPFQFQNGQQNITPVTTQDISNFVNSATSTGGNNQHPSGQKFSVAPQVVIDPNSASSSTLSIALQQAAVATGLPFNSNSPSTDSNNQSKETDLLNKIIKQQRQLNSRK